MIALFLGWCSKLEVEVGGGGGISIRFHGQISRKNYIAKKKLNFMLKISKNFIKLGLVRIFK